jgi:hypothetical protein
VHAVVGHPATGPKARYNPVGTRGDHAMERQKSGPKTPAYPDLRSFVLRHPATASAGILLCALSLSCSGDVANYSPLDTDTGDTASDETVVLPAAGSHRAWLSDGMSYVDYQVEIRVSNSDLAEWVHNDEKDLLSALDATLAEHPLDDFDDEDRNLNPIHDELLTSAADAIDASGKAPKGSLDGVVLTVVAWGVDKIDGVAPK